MNTFKQKIFFIIPSYVIVILSPFFLSIINGSGPKVSTTINS
jgi:hypothetical protein